MDTLLNFFVVLVVVVDPLGNVPMFLSLTKGLDTSQRRQIATRSVSLAGAILLLFLLTGGTILALLGIGVPAFRIAGGILLLLLAIDMVLVRQTGLRSTTGREQQEAMERRDVSVFPLAFPLLAGPGALTTVLLMAAPGRSWGTLLGAVVVVAAVLVIVWFALRVGDRIMRGLGETGANVVTRLLGVLLAALAVQYVLDGIFDAVAGVGL